MLPRPGEGNEFASIKLDERALRRAVSSLNSGRFCEALQVFENSLHALYYSALAGVRAVRPFPKNERFESHLSSRALTTALFPEISKAADSIYENKKLYSQIRQDLIELILLENDQANNKTQEKSLLTLQILNALNVDESDTWNAKKVLVMAQLINLSKLISIPTQISTAKDLSINITEAFNLKLINWGKENQDEFEFSKKLWKYWYEHSISRFVIEN